MNDNFKRLSKYWMIYRTWEISKSIFFLFIFIQLITRFTFISFNILVFILAIFAIFEYATIYLEWRNFKYKITNNNFTIEQGRLFKTKKTFSEDQIQSINTYSPFFHRLFGLHMSVITLGSTGDRSTIKLTMLNDEEINNIINTLNTNHYDNTYKKSEQTLIYQSTLKEIVIGSLTPAKFILFSAFIYAIYNNLVKFFDISILDLIRSNFENINGLIALFFIIAFSYYIYSTIKNYIIYGNYTVHQEDDYLFLSRGVVDKNSIVINKKDIKGINIKYSLLQKVLGICRVNIIYTSSKVDSKNNNSNVFLPFINFDKAQSIIKKTLPDFSYDKNLTNLPKSSVISSLLNNFYIAVILLVLFITNFLNFGFLCLIVLILFILQKFIRPFINAYILDNNKIIFKNIKVNINIYISNVCYLEEINLSQNFIQKITNLSTLSVINKKNPYIRRSMADIPLKYAKKITNRYKHIQ